MHLAVADVRAERAERDATLAIPLAPAHLRAAEAAVEAMRLASHKLPVATRVVVRETAKEVTDGDR